MKKHTTATPIRTRRKALITALEPRILLDGAAVVTIAEMATDVAYQDDSVHSQGAEQSVHFAAPAPIAAESNNRREVAFVDTSVNDYQSLVDGLGDKVEVILINGKDNGLEQMVASLQGQSGLDAIHVFSHGAVGELKLGTLTLNANSVQANAELLSTLGESLTESGDLMLYGCYVGADSEGQSFIDSIASLTLADVAASEDLTGAERLGGNWVLEAGSGLIETSAAAVAGYDGTLAPLVISNLDNLNYKEGDGAVLIDGDVSISGSSDYTGGYLDFTISSATSAESLGFLIDSVPSSVNGQVSIVGSTVFRGDGSNAVVIGSVDAIKNGQNGQALRINFSNAFENGNFQDGVNGSTVIKGWTTVLEKVRLNGVDKIAGQATPIDQTYPASNGAIGDNTSGGNFTKTAQLFSYQVQSGVGDLAIRMNTGQSSIDQGYGVIRGPYVYSNGTVSLQAGDKVSFDWKALSGGDAYDAYGYIVDVNTGKTVTILDSTGTSSNQETSWANKIITIGAGQAGVYRFVFVAGSYDLTGGRAVGGELLIDNVKVTQANPPGPIGDPTITAISQRVTYTNTASDYADRTRVLTVSASDKLANTGSATSRIFLTEMNNAPSFSGDASLASVDEDTSSPAGSTVRALFDSLFNDVDASYDPKDSLAGIIITADASAASDSAQGQWQYSTNGSDWHEVGTVTSEAGLLLSSTASLRFVPAADYNGTPGSLSVHAVDSSVAMSFTSGATRATFNTSAPDSKGGSTAISAAAVSLKTSITAVNDAPVLAAPVGATIVDTAAKDTFDAVTGKLTATDVDSSTLTYGIDGGTDDGTYVTSSSVYGTLKVTKLTGDYTFTPSSNVINGLNTKEVQNFTVTASDGALSSTQILKFTLQGVNDNPIFGAESGSTQVSVFSYPNLNGADDNPRNDNENANLASIVQSIIKKGGQYTLDTSIQNFTDAGFAAKLNASGFFFMTDMETGNPNDTAFLPASAQTDIRNWVGAGGVIMMTGTSGTPDVAFLNRVFGWDLTSQRGSNWSLNTDNAAGTPFQGGPASLDAPSATDSIGAGTVNGFKAIYGTKDNATVAEIGFGAGRVLFLGYDFYDAGIAGTGFTSNAPQYGADVANGSSNTNAWVTEIIPRALAYSASLSSDTTLTETDSTLTTSGKFPVSDVERSDSVSVTVSGVSAEQRNAGGTVMTASPSQPTLEKLQAMLDVGSQPVIDNTTTSADVNWVFNSNTEAFNYLAAGESLVLTYQLTAKDDKGGTATRTLTITINGVNDAPVAQSVTKDVAENDLYEGSVPTASDVDGTIASYLLVSSVASGRGSLTLNSNGSYTFDPGTAFDYLAVGERANVSFTYQAKDNSGAVSQTATITLTVVGSNDVPVVSASTATTSENGQITSNVPAASDVDGTIESYQVVDNVSSGSLTFNSDGTYSFDTGASFDDLAVDESRQVSFTYTATDNNGGISTPGKVTFTITGTNDAPTITAVDVTGVITDGVTLRDTGSIQFADLDLTDRPTASEVTKSVTALRADKTTSLTLSSTQQQAIENAFSIMAADANANNGTINWTYDIAAKDVEFLAKDEVVTAVFTITVNDGKGGTATQNVTVTLTGRSDVPVITVVDVAGAITDGGNLTDAGSITFADLDLTDRPTASEVTKSVTAKLAKGTTELPLTNAQKAAIENAFSIAPLAGNDNNGTINWAYNIAAGDLKFLAKGEVVTAVFTITVNDGQGGTATQDVTVTLTGSDDVPVITVVDVVGAITDGVTLTDTGSIKFADLDLTDRPTASEVTKSVTAKLANGTTELPLTADQKAAIEAAFSIKAADANANNGTIDWAYDIAAGDLKFLAKGEVVTAVFTITVNDGQGGTATQDVTVTLTGSNDVPVITVVDVAGAITDGGTLTDAGSITFADLDLTDRPTASEVTKSVTAKLAKGTTELPLTADQKAAIEAAFSIKAADANANNGTINWAYDLAADDLKFLAKGEVVTAVFTVTVNDGKGGTATQDVSVTLTGSNDDPVINIDAPTDFIEQTDAAVQDLTQRGQVHFGDVDLTDSINISFASNKDIKWTRADNTLVADLPTGLAGALVKAFTTGADSQPHEGQIPWTYNASALNLDFLNAGDTITFSYTVTVTDSQDATASQVVTIRLLGTNDAPELTAYVLTKAETIVQKGADYKLDAAQLFSDKDSTLSREDLDFKVTGLPAGLRYNAETGAISGKSTESGKFQVTVTATDTEGASISQTYELLVTAVVQGDTPSVPRDTTPISAPSVEPQQIKITVSDMPSGLLSNSGSQGAISDSSGYMASSSFAGSESLTFDSTLSSTQGEPLDAGMKKVGATEQVILSERGALVIQTQNPDGKTSVRASVDVSVMRDGMVVFTDVQREAFSSVALTVASIERTADKVLTVTIQDTRQTGGAQLYTGSLSSGESLPSWIKLDPNTGTLTLSNRPAGQKEVSVRIQTIGSDGQARVLELNLDLDELFEGSSLVTDPALIETEGQEPIGFVPLSDQLEAELTAHNNYGDRLMALLQSA